MTKESASAELVAALTKIAAGGVYVSLTMAEQFAQSLNEPTDLLPHQRLSDREFDVFRRVTTGELTEIAHALSVSVKTVSTYKMRILEKMQMANDGARPLRDAHKLFDDPTNSDRRRRPRAGARLPPRRGSRGRGGDPRGNAPRACRKRPTRLPSRLPQLQFRLISLTSRNIHTPFQQKHRTPRGAVASRRPA
jgi:DNA-binding CsgD family transcriptional regulator